MLQKVFENVGTHFVFSNIFSESLAFYEIMWKNRADPAWP